MVANRNLVFRFDDVEVRERDFRLAKAGKALAVEPKAFRALLFFLHNPQRLVSKEELLNAVWGDVTVGDGSLTRCIWLLRSLLGDDIREPRYIATVATVGYRFIGNVEVSEDAPAKPETAQEPSELNRVGKEAGSWKRSRRLELAGGALLALCLAGAIWYLHRPLPPLRVTGYNQITHDGISKLPIGSDGTRLYFTVFDPPSAGQVALSGGQTAPVQIAVPGIAHPLLKDISPDGSSFLVVPEYRSYYDVLPLWSVRILGDSVRRIGSGYEATFSPDGKLVAYTPQWGEIWVVRSDGTDAHKLASLEGGVFSLAWSPDGTTIRFTRGKGHNDQNSFWEMSADGSNPHQLLPSWNVLVNKCCGRWTSSGEFFLFQVTPQRSYVPRSEIWLSMSGAVCSGGSPSNRFN